MPKTPTYIDEETFIEQYKPHAIESDDAFQYVQYDWMETPDMDEIFEATKNRKIRTVIESDNEEQPITIVSGHHRVNRLYYIITEVPFSEGEEIIIEPEF